MFCHLLFILDSLKCILYNSSILLCVQRVELSMPLLRMLAEVTEVILLNCLKYMYDTQL